MAEAHGVLHGEGRRQTSQRALLYDLIRKTGGHIDADELYRKARKKQPRISLSTVYRNLQLFKGLGLIEEHDFSEPHRHFEVKPRSEHQHLLCERCGKIVEFTDPLIDQMKRQVAAEKGFIVSSADVHLVGLCSGCQSEDETSK